MKIDETMELQKDVRLVVSMEGEEDEELEQEKIAHQVENKIQILGISLKHHQSSDQHFITTV